MSTGASAAERERRAAALQGILAELELDALVLAGADYRGHKGVLRWVADYNLVHRYGFAVAAPEREPGSCCRRTWRWVAAATGACRCASSATCARACRRRWRELGPAASGSGSWGWRRR